MLAFARTGPHSYDVFKSNVFCHPLSKHNPLSLEYSQIIQARFAILLFGCDAPPKTKYKLFICHAHNYTNYGEVLGFYPANVSTSNR